MNKKRISNFGAAAGLCLVFSACQTRQPISLISSISDSATVTSMVVTSEPVTSVITTSTEITSEISISASATSTASKKETNPMVTSTVSNKETSQPMTSTTSQAGTSKKAPIYNKPAQPVDVTSFARKTFIASDGTTLPYRLHLPEGYTEDAAYPVFLFLHGAGERGADNEKQLQLAVPVLYSHTDSMIHSAIGIFPQCPEDNQWVDTPWTNSYSVKNVPESNELKAVVELLEDIQGTYSVDRKRLYGFGMSMGGFGIWDLLMRHPGLLAAGVPLCGGGDSSYAAQLAKTPIWTIHSEDDTAVPVKCTKDIVQAIQKADGKKLKYEILQGYGHNVWDYAANKQSLMQWLFC